jgi:hypothetical protein
MAETSVISGTAITLQVRSVVVSHSFLAAPPARVSLFSASDLNARRLGDTAKPSHIVPVELTTRLGVWGVTSPAERRLGTMNDKTTAPAKIEPEYIVKLPVCFAGPITRTAARDRDQALR